MAIILSLRLLGRDNPPARNFFALWFGAATIGFLSVPNFFDHYALPLLVPACSVMAVLLARSMGGLAWAGGLAAFGTIFAGYTLQLNGPARGAQFDRLATLVGQHLNGGCLYVFEGPVHLYTATGACRLTRFVFPDHLNSTIEARAVPVVPEQEIARVFRARPAVVVDAERIFLSKNPASRRMLVQQLACNYRLARVAKQYGARFDQPLHIWVRRPGWRDCPVG